MLAIGCKWSSSATIMVAKNLLFSPDIFRNIYKPLLADLVAHIRKLTGAKIYLHSDGAVASLIQILLILDWMV
jgi:hypothetical protein